MEDPDFQGFSARLVLLDETSLSPGPRRCVFEHVPGLKDPFTQGRDGRQSLSPVLDNQCKGRRVSIEGTMIMTHMRCFGHGICVLLMLASD